MRVSWITNGDAPAIIEYGTSPRKYSYSANGNTTTYSYVLYKSGRIHDVVIGPLDPDTVYYYRCSGSSSREFSFKTPPSDLPIKFVVVGAVDLFFYKRNITKTIGYSFSLPSYLDFWYKV
jgi:acid phosphatase type 7